MDLATLKRAMGNNVISDEELVAFNGAMVAAGCTTVNRAAMWCAQMGHESVGLRYYREIASGAAYEGRADLGNTRPGDGVRYAGRGIIQITGRHNYTEFSKWAARQGIVSSPTYFVDNPTQLEKVQYGAYAASWYWTVARPQINSLCDKRDLEGVTRAINGGLNGLADRRSRWNACLDIGAALLPQEDIDMAAKDDIIGFIKAYVGPIISDVKDIRQQLTGGRNSGEYPGWAQLGKNAKGENLTVVDSLADARQRIIALEARLDEKEGK
ncbi:glycoside hydrolase family 19 protein [Gordonia zhenghanii]|uniref:glycoside hydrolase family 19 protein n=1 Tax=Gordonia zhenghanii TaxID=2911516 RepID=UPI0035AC0251